MTSRTGPEHLTFAVPRFLSFIDLAYLFEAAKVADDVLAARVAAAVADEDANAVGNLNATRQSLLRAVFVSAFGILEQNLDELALMSQKKAGAALSPSDLRDRGIGRSIAYFSKVLGKPIDTSQRHWKAVLLLQEVRNHLVHYGPHFSDTEEHQARFRRFATSDQLELRPAICFTLGHLDSVCEDFAMCVGDFGG